MASPLYHYPMRSATFAPMVTKTALAAAAMSAVFLFEGEAFAGERLDTIKTRGMLTCGVGASSPGFSRKDERGRWVGFDVDICRSVAAALFGNAENVTFKPIDTLPNF